MMRVRHSDRFKQQYVKAPTSVRKAYDKQEFFLLHDLRHPSLRAKKYDERKGIWQARVNRSWRFYFSIEDDVYLLHELMRHPK